VNAPTHRMKSYSGDMSAPPMCNVVDDRFTQRSSIACKGACDGEESNSSS
jgi:hypothetical protein